jgi:hypothetical protein
MLPRVLWPLLTALLGLAVGAPVARWTSAAALGAGLDDSLATLAAYASWVVFASIVMLTGFALQRARLRRSGARGRIGISTEQSAVTSPQIPRAGEATQPGPR